MMGDLTDDISNYRATYLYQRVYGTGRNEAVGGSPVVMGRDYSLAYRGTGCYVWDRHVVHVLIT